MITTTMAAQLVARSGDEGPGLYFEDRTWTWHEVIAESAARAAAIVELLDPDQPPHVGVLAENRPDYLFWLGGAALAGATIVGINPTRRGGDLARDITHTDCQVLLVDTAYRDLVTGPETTEAVPVPIIGFGSDEELALVEGHRGAALPVDLPDFDANFLLLFTSGSTSAPKAVPCSNGRAGTSGAWAAQGFGVSGDDVVYCPMPLFHGNALLACWSVAIAVGAPVALRPRFSASEFLPDVRRYGCTYFTYVGRTISYLLAQPSRPEDSDNPLRLGFGTEAPPTDRQAFAERFGAVLVEGYGSSESAISITRTPDSPPGALGRPRPEQADSIAVVDPATGNECPPGILDASGHLTNATEAIGELVNRDGAQSFTGYYNNPEASAERLRNGWFWSGDLAWRDTDGFYYFAGRSADWMRVDSENLAAAPIAELLLRFGGVTGAVVHGVPDERTGDQVMAVLEMAEPGGFDPVAFESFLGEQPDLGSKWAPRFVRVVSVLMVTANNKVDAGNTRRAGVEALRTGTDNLWWRPGRDLAYERFGSAERTALLERYESHDRLNLLDL